MSDKIFNKICLVTIFLIIMALIVSMNTYAILPGPTTTPSPTFSKVTPTIWPTIKPTVTATPSPTKIVSIVPSIRPSASPSATTSATLTPTPVGPPTPIPENIWLIEGQVKVNNVSTNGVTVSTKDGGGDQDITGPITDGDPLWIMPGTISLASTRSMAL